MENKKCKRAGADDKVQVEVPESDGAIPKQEGLYQVEEQMLRAIFPEETWLLILNKVVPEDQENCAKASPYFCKLLKEQRVVYLFPKVIEIMALIFEQKYNVSKVNAEDEYADQTPVIMDAREWKNAVTSCRLVCSFWNKAIENCYQSPVMAGIPQLENPFDPRSKVNNVRRIYWTKQNLSCDSNGTRRHRNKFLDHFERSHHSGVGAPPKNPFLGRYLKVDIRRAYFFPGDRANSDAIEVLKKFGKEVWYLELHLDASSSYPMYVHFNVCAMFRNLRAILLLVPNLRFLQIHSREPIPNISSQSGKHHNIILCSPLPKFEKLEILSMENLGCQIGSELIRKNKHVNFLKIWGMDAVDEDIGNSLEMPNLKGLSVAESLAGDAMLEKFGPRWKNVKNLYYGHLYRKTGWYSGIVLPTTVGMGAAQAFATFQKNWESTLTEVYLQHPFGFNEETILEESKTLRLNLPRVRKLTLCVFNFGLFLDFMLPLKESLEHFVFQYGSTKPLRNRMMSKQSIHFAGFEEKMEISNIWKVFGRLETIKLEVKGYGDSSLGGYDFRLFTKEKDKLNYSMKNGLSGAGMWAI